jgi:peptide/nickel transport system substrate-binding protein
MKKNPNWDPKSDPIRHQYVDKIVFDFQGGQRDAQTQRMIADKATTSLPLPPRTWRGPDRAGAGRPAAARRAGQGATLFVDYIGINTPRD